MSETFKRLSVGDKIYFIKKNGRFISRKDSSGYEYNVDVYGFHEIKSIHLEDGRFVFNKRDYRNSLLSLNDDEASLSTYTDSDGTSFFTSLEVKNRLLREAVLCEIESSEKYIQNVVFTKNEYIKELREEYYEILNPSSFKK